MANDLGLMLKDGALEGKTILVTGGGTGLGRAMSEAFSQLGANVVIASRKLEVIQQTAKEIEDKTGNSVLGLQCDVRDYVQVEKMIADSIEKYGKVDVLVNNAAGNFVSPTERLSNRAFDTIVDIVLKGTYNCTLALGKIWIANKQPANVLSIVTTYAWTGSGYVVPSACAKAGVLTMTKSLASEWGKYGIRLNAIAPGPFPTEGAFSRLFPKEVHEMMNPMKRIPLQRLGELPELANLATYLVSDYAGYVNGEVVTIDGGEWLKGAGEFNMFDEIPQQMWDMLEQAIRKTNKK